MILRLTIIIQPFFPVISSVDLSGTNTRRIKLRSETIRTFLAVSNYFRFVFFAVGLDSIPFWMQKSFVPSPMLSVDLRNAARFARWTCASARNSHQLTLARSTSSYKTVAIWICSRYWFSYLLLKHVGCLKASPLRGSLLFFYYPFGGCLGWCSARRRWHAVYASFLIYGGSGILLCVRTG